MSRLGIITLGPVLVALSAAGYAQAQEQKPLKPNLWISAHMGPSVTPKSAIVSVGFSISRGRSIIYQLSANGVLASIVEPFWVNSASVGIAQLHRYTMLSVFAGPSLVSTRAVVPDGSISRRTSAGLSVNAQAAFLPLEGLGLGIDLLGTVSPLVSYASIRVAFIFGRM